MGNNQSNEVKVPDEDDAASVIQKSWKKQQATEFEWPEDLYTELLDMAETDQMVNYVSLLFKAARMAEVEFMVPASESAEKPKLTLAQLQSLVEANKEALSKSKAFTADPEEVIKALKKMGESTSPRKLSIVGLDAAALKSKDMSYCIVKDDKLKRITVVFPAGNSALKDEWVNSRSFKMIPYTLPRALKAKISGDRIASVKVHAGFYNYLNQNGLKKSLIKDLKSVATPSYKVYITGHGIGAALASLLSLELAFDHDLAKPICCINFGSPRVGDSSYWRACQLLEIAGKLRKCRVITDTDTLVTVPASAEYAHSGYQVMFKAASNGAPEEYYPSVKDDGSMRKGAFASTKKFNESKSTSASYLASIKKSEASLKKMNLNEMYEKAGVPAFAK